MKNINTYRIAPILRAFIILMFFGSCMNCATDRHPKETGFFTDPRDGRIYKTVKIGNQWIMAENLAYKPDQGSYWAYNNDTGNSSTYGYLYDWETAMKVAPDGWHLPSKKEWKVFRKSLGSTLEITSYERKVYKQMVAGGSSGFEALFGGAYIISYNEFRGIGETAYFLSSTMTGNGPVNYVVDRKDTCAFITSYADPNGGKSVRLFKD